MTHPRTNLRGDFAGRLRLLSLLKAALAVAFLAFGTRALPAEPLTFESGETQAALIELFTSEGCSSCPPADAWIGKLKASPDLWKRVVPVVFHVDYWDRLGWPDRFASATNTARQRRYAAAWRSDSVYTPGVVLNGREWRTWSQHGGLPELPQVKAGKLRLTVSGENVSVSFAPGSGIPKILQAEFALLGGNIETDVKGGENSGRKLRHDFTVLHFASAPMRATGGGFVASVSLSAKSGETPVAIAAWVTAGDAQPPVQAAGGWLKVR